MKERLITVRSKPLTATEGGGDQGVMVADVAICTKDGMDVRVRGDNLALPDTECYFYVKLDLPWNRPDGGRDYEEIITDGNNFYIAFRSLGQQRLKWTNHVQNIVLGAIKEFVENLA